MNMWKQLLKLLLAICLSQLAFACKYYPPTDCHDGSYKAESLLVKVITSGPTKLAKATADNDDKILAASKDIAFGAIGEIKGGSFVTGLIDGITGLSGGKSDTDKLFDLYNQLVDEINNLTKYIDDKMMKASVEWLEAELGTAVPRAGLLGVAMKVKGRTGTDLMRSLDSLNTLLIVKFNHFVPKSDSVASYERTLPLFRIYGDLYVTTLVSEIAEFKRVRQHYDAAMKVTELQNVVSRFQQHWTKACGNILADRTRLPNYDCIYFPYMHGAKIATTCRTKMEGKVCYVSTDCYSSRGSFADEYATKNAESSSQHFCSKSKKESVEILEEPSGKYRGTMENDCFRV